MKALVTGGAGFIGSALVERLLDEGHAVAVLDDFNDFYDPQIKRANLKRALAHIRLHEADIRDAAAVDRVLGGAAFDTVFHIAARAGVRPSILQPRLYIDTNVSGTFNLLESARKHGVARFIFASSSSVYGVIKTTPFSEEMCINQTISPYAATKIAGRTTLLELLASLRNALRLRAVLHGLRPAPASRPRDPQVYAQHF